MKLKELCQRKGVQHAGLSLSLIALVLCLFYLGNLIVLGLSNKLGWYWVTTEQYDLTIGAGTDAALAPLDTGGTPVRVTFCSRRPAENSQLAEIYETVCQMAEKYPEKVQIDCIDLWLEPHKVSSWRENADGTENTIEETTVIFSHGDAFLLQSATAFYALDSSNYVIAYNGEETAVASLLWVCETEHPIAYFTQNHGEEAPVALQRLLLYAGYQIQSLDLSALSGVPEDAGLVVISSPLYDFQASAAGASYVSELDKLDAYLAQGGLLYVALDAQRLSAQPHLCAFLSAYGITPQVGVMQDHAASLPGSSGYALICDYADTSLTQPLRDAGRRTVLPYAAALSLTSNSQATTEPLLYAPASATLTDGAGSTLDSGAFPVAAVAHLSSGGDLLLFGSADVATSSLMLGESYGNKQLHYRLIAACTGRTVPADIASIPVDRSALEDLTTREADIFTFSVAVLVPLLILGAGIYVTVRRKNR